MRSQEVRSVPLVKVARCFVLRVLGRKEGKEKKKKKNSKEAL